MSKKFNQTFKPSRKTILGGAFLCIVLLFSSCDNFLKGAVTKELLEEAIEIANSNPVTYYVIADNDSGTVTPTQLRLKRKEKFDVMFIPADGWKFVCWEVLDRTTYEVVTDSIKFEDPQKLETKGTVINPKENLMIHPKCTLVPKVMSIEPASIPGGCRQDESIVITFNKPMDPLTFGDFSCISIINEDGTRLFSSDKSQTYFEQPKFSEDNTVLTITTVKGKPILDGYATNQLAQITITLNLSTVKDSEGLSVEQNEQYSYYINQHIDDIAPVLSDMHLYSTSDTSDYFYRELSKTAFEQWSSEDDFHKNHVSRIYITFDGYDKDSGIQNVIVEETYKKDTSGVQVSSQVKTKALPVSLITETGLYAADYQFNEENLMDGLYCLKIWINDYSNNQSAKKFEYWVIKDTSNNFATSNFAILGNKPGNNIDDALPVYNADKKIWEAPLGGNSSVNTPGVFKTFTIPADKYYLTYESNRFISVEIYDEDSPQNVALFTTPAGKASDVKSIMNTLLATFKRNVDKTAIFKVTVKDEAGVLSTFEAPIPKRLNVRGITDLDKADYRTIMLDDYKPLGNTLTQLAFYTKGTDKTLYPGDDIYDARFPISEDTDIYNVYTIATFYHYRVNFRMYSALGTAYVYDKNQTDDTSFVFPLFSLPDEDDIVYTDSETAKFTIPVTEHSNDVIINVAVTAPGYSYCFAEGSIMEVRSGKKYDVSLIAIGTNGNYIAQSEPYAEQLDLTKKDNLKPNRGNIIDFNNQTKEYIQTNAIKIQGWPQDVTPTGSTPKLQSFDCYLLPPPYTAMPSYTKEFLQSVSEYKQTIKYVSSAANTNFYLYTGNVDGNCRLVFYLEDENRNYFIYPMDSFIKHYIADYVPTVKLSSTDNSKIEIIAGNYSQELCKAQDAPTTEEFYGDWASDYLKEQQNFAYKKENKVSIQWLRPQSTEWLEQQNGSDYLTNESMTEEQSDGLWHFEFPHNNKSRFIKITGKFSSGYNYYNEERSNNTVFMKPVYVYTDYLRYKGTANEIVCNSKGVLQLINGYQIYVDQPCFIHVCSCPILLTSGTTQDDIDEWEARGYEIGLMYNDGTSGTFTYDNSHADDVPAGWYYTTIIHFADGTAVMSEVKQKQ